MSIPASKYLNLPVSKYLLVPLFFSVLFFGAGVGKASAATKYFINGGVDHNMSTNGNWSTSSGGPANTTAPTDGDDVILDNHSPICNIDDSFGANLNSFTQTSGYLGIMTGDSDNQGTLYVAGNFTGNGNWLSYQGEIIMDPVTNATFTGNGLRYHYLEISGTTTIIGNNMFDTLSSDNSQHLYLTAGSITAALYVRGGGIISSTSTQNATLNRAGGGVVIATSTSLQNITGTPAGAWYFRLGTDAGNNINITFGQPSVLPLFVDSAVSGGYGTGASWTDAISSIPAIKQTLLADDLSTISNIVYVKANDTPIRIAATENDFGFKNVIVYFNATGNGTQLGAKQAKIYGSQDKTASSWTQVGSSGVYYTSHTPTSGSSFSSGTVGSRYVWLLNDATGAITPIVGNNPIDPTLVSG